MRNERIIALISLSTALTFWTSCSDETKISSDKNMEISNDIKSNAISKTGIETGFSASKDENRKYVGIYGYFQVVDSKEWATLNKTSYTKNNETTVELSAPNSAQYQNIIVSKINGYSCYSTQNIDELSLGDNTRVTLNEDTEIGIVSGYCKVSEGKYFLVSLESISDVSHKVKIQYITTQNELEFIQKMNDSAR